jgi:hypothetical protein
MVLRCDKLFLARDADTLNKMQYEVFETSMEWLSKILLGEVCQQCPEHQGFSPHLLGAAVPDGF